jgi:hypothetical protein
MLKYRLLGQAEFSGFSNRLKIFPLLVLGIFSTNSISLGATRLDHFFSGESHIHFGCLVGSFRSWVRQRALPFLNGGFPVSNHSSFHTSDGTSASFDFKRPTMSKKFDNIIGPRPINQNTHPSASFRLVAEIPIANEAFFYNVLLHEYICRNSDGNPVLEPNVPCEFRL